MVGKGRVNDGTHEKIKSCVFFKKNEHHKNIYYFSEFVDSMFVMLIL